MIQENESFKNTFSVEKHTLCQQRTRAQAVPGQRNQGKRGQTGQAKWIGNVQRRVFKTLTKGYSQLLPYQDLLSEWTIFNSSRSTRQSIHQLPGRSLVQPYLSYSQERKWVYAKSICTSQKSKVPPNIPLLQLFCYI